MFTYVIQIGKMVELSFQKQYNLKKRKRKPCFRIDFANYTDFFLFPSFADARFFDLSSTYYSDKRQSAARFWQMWYNTTPLYSNGPGQKPYNGDIFGGGKRGPPAPATLAPEVTPTVGVFFRTDSQFSVEQSVATRVYEQSSYGRLKRLRFAYVDHNTILHQQYDI